MKIHKSSFPKLLLLTSCSVFCLQALAENAPSSDNSFIPYTPGVTATVLSGDLMSYYADTLLPVYGSATQFLYLDTQGQFNNTDQYSGSLGVGGRYLWSDRGILGAYVFGDYNRSQEGNNFWFISPGVEFLGNSVDVTSNLYIPIATQKYTDNDVFGQDIGIYDGVSFQGHDEYDAIYDTSETTGLGGDIDLAYRIPVMFNPKVHLIGYFSNPEDSDSRLGGGAKFDLPVTRNIQATVSEAYDNISKNTVRAGLSYSFGGRHTSYHYDNDLESRMADQIQRNAIANVGDIRNSQPIAENAFATDTTGVYLTNISFFSPTSASSNSTDTQDGTYENPYAGMSQQSVGDANSQGNNNFFVASGQYGSASSGMDSITLTNDNVMGRESYDGRQYVKEAQGVNSPQFYFNADGFNLLGNNSLSAVSLISNQPGVGNAINVSNLSGDSAITIDQVMESGFQNGLYAINSGDNAGAMSVSVTHSTFNANTLNGLYFVNDSNADMNVNVDHVNAMSNGSNGIKVVNGDPSGTEGTENTTSGTMEMTVDHSVINNNDQANFDSLNRSTNTMTANLDNSHFDSSTYSGGVAFKSDGNGAYNTTISNSTVDNNNRTGIFIQSGIYSGQGSIDATVINGSEIQGNNTSQLAPGTLVIKSENGSSSTFTVDDTQGAPVLFDGVVSSTGTGVWNNTVNFISANGQNNPAGDKDSVICDSAGNCTVTSPVPPSFFSPGN